MPYTEALQLRTLSCTDCGHGFQLEVDAEPDTNHDGEPICTDCYLDANFDDCALCGESVQKEELESKPGELIVIFERVPALGDDDLLPGYYRVLGWPFFSQGLIGSGYFHATRLTRVARLDTRGKAQAKNADCPSGPMCRECQRLKLTRLRPHPWGTDGGNHERSQ